MDPAALPRRATLRRASDLESRRYPLRKIAVALLVLCTLAALSGCKATTTARDTLTRGRAESCDALCYLAPAEREARIAEVNALTTRGTYGCACDVAP